MPGPKIFIVEDELLVAMHIRETLEHSGYSVPGVAISGDEAIRGASELKPDLVLMDIKLQGEMDGIEAARQIRSEFDIPVVYLTAFTERKIVERAKSTDSFGYMIKPFRSEALISTIEIALQKHQTEKKLRANSEWLSTVLRSISDGVIAADMEGIVRLINPAAQVLTGWSEEEALGRPLKDIFKLVCEKTTDPVELPMEKVIRQGKLFGPADHLLITKSGKQVSIRYSAAPIRNGENLYGIIAAFYDVTERKRTDQEREKLIEDLQTALGKAKTLSGLLPICASCKKIRDDKGQWRQIEVYLNDRTGVEFSHSVCPECAKRLYPNFYKDG